MDIKVITYSDLRKCPKGSLSAAHFHADGRCKCSEREAADAALAEAQAEKRAADEKVAAARRWRETT